MMWIIILIVILINELTSDEYWSIKSVRNFGAIVLFLAVAEKNLGTALVFAIIGLSIFVAIELYRVDEQNSKSKSREVERI